eukprot:523554-Ditylum_brightwellii.AAC.1
MAVPFLIASAAYLPSFSNIILRLCEYINSAPYDDSNHFPRQCHLVNTWPNICALSIGAMSERVTISRHCQQQFSFASCPGITLAAAKSSTRTTLFSLSRMSGIVFEIGVGCTKEGGTTANF